MLKDITQTIKKNIKDENKKNNTQPKNLTTYEIQMAAFSMKENAEKYRQEMVEAAAEQDDELMMKYLDGQELTTDEIKLGLRKGTLNNKIIPMTCGSSYKNKGVQELLDAVIDYLPSPIDIPHIKGKDEAGNVLGIWEVIRDITQRKQANAQLILSAEAFARYSDGVILTDENEIILTANDAFTASIA